METGTVLNVRGDMVTWRCERTGEVHTDRMSELQKISNNRNTQTKTSPSGVRYKITRG